VFYSCNNPPEGKWQSRHYLFCYMVHNCTTDLFEIITHYLKTKYTKQYSMIHYHHAKLYIPNQNIALNILSNILNNSYILYESTFYDSLSNWLFCSFLLSYNILLDTFIVYTISCNITKVV